ncbi:maleylpyruvate isomerase family mycothiol-dependent enzyme [Micromonospora sp. KC723]|uniref:maleylpyruvate isomerase family mycothiol-dependent enzyme n=1 Tax=Micromonospora sp. KC723 TaxID=2530381 RepID=UPI001FB7D692|nr:maleylpyruvate isomerase family mycothiol-dependent enzyme [Micromonospora sp. KC723]
MSRAHGRLLHLADRLDDEQLRADSLLPGWTRAHVLAHLADNAWAFERQARCALRGELVEMYDGGQAARDSSIEQWAPRPRSVLLQHLSEAQKALEDVWSTFTGADWSRPVRFRNATVLDTVLARWREAEIHAVDLDLGYTPRQWPVVFALHALDFLAARSPVGLQLTLRADDVDVIRAVGAGTPVEVTGAAHDLAAWMAGRATDGALSTPSGTLPPLGPWPPDPAD